MSFISDRTSALSLSTGAPVGAIGLDKNPLALTTSQPSRSFLFIDAGVTDSEQLAAGAAAGTQVYRLTAGDAVGQITQVLAGMRDVDSVQIVSHGRSGGLQLGESWLNLQTLPGYVNQLKSWSQALTAGADILLYGCNVAQGESGKAFVNLLAQATGADVAASDDLTGSAALGGDWDLEVKTGKIEATSSLLPLIQQHYQGILDFTADTSISLPGVYVSSVAWGDYTGDGKLDLIISGSNGSGPITNLYKNNGSGSLVADTSIFLSGVYNSSVAWGDYTGDGKLDLIISGYSSFGPITNLYKNNGSGSLVADTSISLPGVSYSSVAWGDYTGDGKLDLIISGYTGSASITKLYKNNGSGSLVADTSISLSGAYIGSVAWGDYTGDGKLDLIISGYSDSGRITNLYQNNGSGSLVADTSIFLPGVYNSSVAWGDYTGDGKLDLIISGYSDSGRITKLYQNNGSGSLVADTSISLPGVEASSVAWGDYTGDGKLDLIISGYSDSGRITNLYQNNGSGSLVADTSIFLPGVNIGSVAWGDYTGDGKLDLIISGYSSSGQITNLYKQFVSNQVPVLSLPSTTPLTYTENGNALAIDSTATLTDDNTNFNTGVLTVSLAGSIASDRLSIQTANGITLNGRKVLAGGVQIGTIDTTDRGSNGILKINLLAAATPALTQNLLRSIAYSNLSDALTDGTRILSVVLTDGSGGTSTAVTKSIAVTEVNDAPLIAKKTVLYNGTYIPTSSTTTTASGLTTTTATTQGWTSQSIHATSGGSSAAISTANGLTTLTTNTAIYAGLARQDQVLDASAGFVLSFQANVIAETLAASAQKDDDAKTDRAAFSLTLVTSDTTKAIELGFTKTNTGIRIFAQEDGTNQTNPSLEPDTAGNPDITRQLFTQAESVDTTNPTTGYDLYIKGNTYTLFRDGTAILSGKLRNYSAAIVPLPANPYTTANFMSFGDGTASAFGQFSLGQISLLNGSLSAQTIDEDTSTTAQTFGVFDVEGNTVNVSNSSSNTALVNTANVTIAGTGNNQTITVTPIANASGQTTITLTANDGNATNNTSTSGFGLTVNAINDAPTAVTFTNTTTTIAENTSTTSSIRVADINITDDALGTNTLSLTGTDAANFEIISNVLYLKSGVTLDYETKKKYDVTVNVDDTTVGTTPDAIQNFTLNVTDINEAPTFTTIANQTLLKNKTSNLINFTIVDPEAGNLTVTATSGNTSIIANSGIAIGGSGNNRTLTLTPNTNQTGASEITISISDGTNITTQKFTLNVTGPTSETLLRNSASGEVVVWGLNDSQITASDYCKLSNGTIVRPDATWKIISNKSDFDNDGIRDIVWFNTASTESVIWYMSEGTSGINNIIKSSTALFLPNETSSFKPGNGWQISAVGDLMGDSLSEFLWENRVTGQTVIWQLNIAQNGRAEVNTTTSRAITLNGAAFSTGGATSGWKIIGIGNFDGDTTTKDVLWFNEISKRSVVWQLNNGAIASSGYITINGVPVESGPFKPVAIGNLDGVGTDEIIWQNDTAVVIWDMGSNLALGNRNFLLNQPLLAGEQIQGLADIDLNGSLDLVVRRKSNGPDTTQIYYLNPTTLQLATQKPKQFITLQDPNTPFVTNDARWDIV